MAINLTALNAKEITTFTRSQTEPAAYRLNTDKIKENWDGLKANSKDLVEISTSIDLEGLDTSGGLKRTECNSDSSNENSALDALKYMTKWYAGAVKKNPNFLTSILNRELALKFWN